MNIKIIYEDEYLLVINKPAGVVSNRAESVKGETLQDFMEEKIKNQKSKVKTTTKNLKLKEDEEIRDEQEFRSRSGLVHRLDKDTSGVMVLAKDAETFQFLKNQFKKRKTRKKYVALVHGEVKPKKGSVNLPIKRSVLNRHKFCVNVDGKLAKTEYKVLKVFSMGEKRREKGEEKSDGEKFSLVEVEIFTGRTHQIRVHMSHLGYSLVSDPLYLGKRLKENLLWCPRMFLFAKYLSFIHPKSGKRIGFEVETPNELKKALGKLELYEN